MDYSDGSVGKVGFINLEPSGTIKEKADNFVCELDYQYLTDTDSRSSTNLPEEG